MKQIIWLRNETKPLERRAPLSPQAVKIIIENGYSIFVESSKDRIYSDKEYKDAGAQIVPSGSWKGTTKSSIILGLKELPENSFPLKHRHIYFAHCFKKQAGYRELLNRFSQGNGKLYDIEFVKNNMGKRLLTFGYWAGYVGAALAIHTWKTKILKQSYNLPQSFASSQELLNKVKADLSSINKKPKVLIIGSKGESGTGTIKFLEKLNIQATQWTSKDTKDKGPFKEILEYDILINCALITKKIKPFLTKELISNSTKNLSVISDVSCNPSSPFNPLPIYNKITTIEKPTIEVEGVTILAIDHLPSLLPKESSKDFSNQFLPLFLQFLKLDIERSPWGKALELFYQQLFENQLEMKKEATIKNTQKTNKASVLF